MSPSPSPNRLPAAARRQRCSWRTNLVMFLMTVLSVFWVGSLWTGSALREDTLSALLGGWTFAVPLLTILLAHEFGHYIAARLHRVDASLPFFLPIPVAFGTLGAVIVMPPIRSRKALLDIGAAGPLAGMLFAVPILYLGLTLSTVAPQLEGSYTQEGQSLLYWALKRLALGPIPATHDVVLHPTALAGWAGLFVTFLNLLPYGQLDGGHVSFAVFGERHNRVAPWFVFVPLALILYNAVIFLLPPLARAWSAGFEAVPAEEWLPGSAVFPWVALLLLLLALRSRRLGGPEHPPVAAQSLSPGRRKVGLFTLALFVLLFMPTPLTNY